MVTKLIKPVTHKVHLTLFVKNLSLYHLLISVFNSKKEKFTIQNKEFYLWSKQGGFKILGTQNLAFEYGLTSGDKISPSKITIFFKPFFGEGTETKEGKINNIKKIGTDIEVSSSYYDLDDILNLIQEFLKQIGGERFYEMINTKEGKLLSLERHVRYNEEKEPEVREVFRIIHELSATRGEYDIRDTVGLGNTIFYKISSPTYEFLGFTFPYQVDIKTYRFDAYKNRDKMDALHHPKLEVFIGKSKEYPTVAEYETVKAQLDEFLLNLCHFAGLENRDFVEDLYFQKVFHEYNIKFRPWKPEGYTQAHDTNAAILNHSLPIHNDNMMKCLAIIANSENGYITVKHLQKISHIPERSIWRYINYFKGKGIIETINEGITSVFFPSRIIWKAVKGAMEILARYLDFGIVHLYGQAFVRKDVYLSHKEKNELKALERFGEINKTPIVLETRQQAQNLIKNLRGLRIRRPIFIESEIRPLW